MVMRIVDGIQGTGNHAVVLSIPGRTGMLSRPTARLIPVPRTGLPGSFDPFLADARAAELFDSRLWYDTVLRHALPRDAQPVMAVTDAAVLPLVRDGRMLRSLVTDYTLAWRPLAHPSADQAALRAAGDAVGRVLRLTPPAILDAVDAQATGLAPLLAGLRDARIVAMRFDAFGNWHECLPPGWDWDAFLATRPPALRNTVLRKLPRAQRAFRFERIDATGAALDAGIRAYAAVRAASWKPHEPFPDFDGALMRTLADAGQLRLGVLWNSADGQAVAAQYWALDGAGRAEGRRATVLKLAHAEAAKAASPGTVLTALMIRGLITDDAVRRLDFGRGDDAYKRLWVSRRRQRIGFVLADPLHPLGALAMARQGAGAVRRRLRSLLSPRATTV
jgi:hypothetical protein